MAHLTKTEAAVWQAWNDLPECHPAPAKAIAAKLGMTPADVAFIVFPAETFGRWEDDQEPDVAEVFLANLAKAGIPPAVFADVDMNDLFNRAMLMLEGNDEETVS